MGRSEDELFEAAHEVGRDWYRLAQLASDLTVIQQTRRDDTSTRDAFLARNRALIRFVCGSPSGRRKGRDIQPRDFLDRNWWPDDEDIDRRLRGRLEQIDVSLTRIAWDRVTDPAPATWPIAYMAWETTWGLTQFVQVLLAERRAVAPAFAESQRQVYAALPAYEPAPLTDQPYAAARDPLE